MAADERPPFDDTRKAIEFALNYEAAVRPPVATRAMVENAKHIATLARAKKRRRQKAKAIADLDTPEGQLQAQMDRQETAVGRSGHRNGPPVPRDLDAAHLAGFILAQLDRMEPHFRTLLTGRCARAHDSCACGRPCCAGWSKNPTWARAVEETCEHLRQVGDVTREPGKKGLSTNPVMRRAIVERYYADGTQTLTDIAHLGQVSMVTAARHRDWIVSYLEQEENLAWIEADLILGRAGVTGSFN